MFPVFQNPLERTEALINKTLITVALKEIRDGTCFQGDIWPNKRGGACLYILRETENKSGDASDSENKVFHTWK